MKSTKGRHLNSTSIIPIMGEMQARAKRIQKRIMPTVIATDITGVSPMTAPSPDLVKKMKAIRASKKKY